MKQITEIMLFLSIWSVVVPAMIGILIFPHLDKPSRFISVMTITAVVPQLIRYLTNEVSIKYITYNIYLLAEFSLSVCYFWIFLCFNCKIRSKCISYYTVFFLSIYLSLIFIKGITVFFSELVCISNLFILACILICYYKEVDIKGKSILSTRNPHFFYFIGWIFYTPITSLMFALWNFLKKNPESMLQNLWIIHSLGNLMMYLLFTLGFIINWKERTNFDMEAKIKGTTHVN